MSNRTKVYKIVDKETSRVLLRTASFTRLLKNLCNRKSNRNLYPYDLSFAKDNIHLSFVDMIHMTLDRIGINISFEILNQLKEGENSKEHPYYHPEGTLGAHIFYCIVNALYVANEDDGNYVEGFEWTFENLCLVLSALFHDIVKSGECQLLGISDKAIDKEWYGISYRTFHNHPKAAISFLSHQNIRSWFLSNFEDEALYSAVKTVCGQHMRMKSFMKGLNGEQGGMGENKRQKMIEKSGQVFPIMEKFTMQVDKMR